MHVNPPAVSRKSRACLVLCIASLLACHKKNESPPPGTAGTAAISSDSAKAITEPADTSMDEAAIPADTTEPGPDASTHPIQFTSKPVTKAFPGKPWQYRPSLSGAIAFKLRIVKGADSSMKEEKGQLSWTPGKEGRYPVALEAALPAPDREDAFVRVQQSFVITVTRVLNLALKPLPAQVGKGDTVSFDLRESSFPAWASPYVTVRFDFQGDGTWDTEALPLADNLLRRQAYESVGRYFPKVEARYQDLEIRNVEGAVVVISAVMPVLKISPDTVEPGGVVSIDASESKGDGNLSYALDLDGDGKTDWLDSASGKATLKAPGSGVYQAALTARNPMGQEGKVSAVLRVNARPKLELKTKNPKENMSAQVEFKVRTKDADDTLAKVRFNFTGAADAWETRQTPPDSLVGPGEWWLRFKHAYGKIGKYTAAFCATSRDGREACQQAAVEIFNAPPVCQPGPDLKATLGKPLEIDGTGTDPDGKIVKWEWDLNGDGKFDLVSAANGKFQYTFSKEGVFALVLRVTTADGVAATGSRKVEVRKRWKT
jgi:hypothetical protein